MTTMVRLLVDFNGIFGDLLCLSHSNTCRDEAGNEVVLQPGMRVIAFVPDSDYDGNEADLVATGTVEPSPDWLQCNGSRWSLRVDDGSIRDEPAK